MLNSFYSFGKYDTNNYIKWMNEKNEIIGEYMIEIIKDS